MSDYPSTPKLDLKAITTSVSNYWKKYKIFEKTLAATAHKPKLHFYEGPPGANGKPGIHHVFSRTLKDLFCRYKTMCSYHVPRKSGWDTHGLPVELAVEKELGITKEDIGTKITIEAYNQKCKVAVMHYTIEGEDVTEKIGYWIDLENPYMTYHPHYISTLWGILKRFYQKKLLYKGYSIQPYSPSAGTGLSTHELNQPGCYKEVKDTTIVAQFAITHLSNTYLLAWTTTPWTLPANSALAVGKKITYVAIATYNRYTYQPIQVILAKDAIPRYFESTQENASMKAPTSPNKPLPWHIVATYTGADLLGWQYEQLLPYVKPTGKAFRVVEADFVTTVDGTGIVHLAPTFGADDYRTAQQHAIPSITVVDEQGNDVPIVDKQGRFVKEITDFAHVYVKKAYDPNPDATEKSVDIQIAIALKKQNKAFLVATYTHSYPHCWRTHKPILYYPLDAWFIKTTACRERLIELNKTINWQPASTGSGRFGRWLENLVDWNLTRARFWGTPLPIWRTKDGSEEKCIGGIQELRSEVENAIAVGFMKEQLPEELDLHRPYVDKIVLVSEKGQKMYREEEVIDVWFDAGAMPYAQHQKLDFDADKLPVDFPAAFIIEGVDQTRGWFFTLHAISTLLHDKVAFKNVLSTGLVLDKNGLKMSKSQHNTIDPNVLLKSYSPDVVRWYMVANANPWDDLKFNVKGVAETQRKFFATLHNTYQFFALYANLDNFQEINPLPNPAEGTQSDQWILSKLQGLITTTRRAYDDFSPTQAARAIEQFTIKHLSNWYVRLNRKRFWQGGYTEDKRVAYQTLHYCLRTIVKLAAPIAPFYMEHLYKNLSIQASAISVHLVDFPVVETAYLNMSLEKAMELAQQITTLVHRIRKQKQLKVRQPLAKLWIPITHENQQEVIEQVAPLICAEVNVKEVCYLDNQDELLHLEARPNYSMLSKRYGAQLKEITMAIKALTSSDIRQLQKKGSYTLAFTPPIVLAPEDLLITTRDIPGRATAQQGEITVALELKLTPELIEEGLARELVNRIQNLRKDIGLAVEDKILLSVNTGVLVWQSAMKNYATYIQEEVQANAIVETLDVPATTFELPEGTIEVAIQKM